MRVRDPYSYEIIDAAKKGNVAELDRLNKLGADIHYDGDDALCWASYFGKLDAVKYLLSYGANINARNGEPICWASANGHTELVQFLLENGADPRARRDYPLRMAIEHRHLKILEMLKQARRKTQKIVSQAVPEQASRSSDDALQEQISQAIGSIEDIQETQAKKKAPKQKSVRTQLKELSGEMVKFIKR